MARHLGFNPLSFYLTVDGWHPELAPPLPAILKTVKDAGYDGIHADIPADSTPKAYLRLLNDHGLEPAPGYFQASFAASESLSKAVEDARRVAADHAQLGLNRVFIAEQFGAEPQRIATPAVGVGGGADQLARIADGLRKVASAMTTEGVIPCLHSHVGTLIETVEETEFMLDHIDSNVLLLGPDTGHLSWAGADLTSFLKRHAARVGAVHIKDYRKDIAENIRATGKGYHDAGAAHIWTEPGRGSVDLEAALDVLAPFEGWFVVEVDIADQPTVEESAQLSAQWLRPRLAQH